MVQQRNSRPSVPVLMAIDDSGSMWKVAEDVRGGFNQYVTELGRDTLNTYKVTLVLFNTTVERLQTSVEPTDVVALDDVNYAPHGGTALLDAIGDLITGYEAQEGERPLVVVHTDGEENSSREWRIKALTALIAEKKRQGWGFVFLGADLDTWQGERMGFSSARTVNTREGNRGTYAGLTVGTVAYAGGAGPQSVTETAGQWSRDADAAARQGFTEAEAASDGE